MSELAKNSICIILKSSKKFNGSFQIKLKLAVKYFFNVPNNKKFNRHNNAKETIKLSLLN